MNTQTNVNVDEKKESKTILRIAFFAFFLNLILSVVKGILTGITDSIAVTASVVDSATDSVASLAVFAGIILSTKKTSRFPLGLYKIENFISVAVAIFIFIAGYEIGKTIFLDSGDAPVYVSLPVVIVMAVATAIVFSFGKIAASVGRRTGSPALRAEGKHRQIDALSSALVLISALLAYLEVRISVFGITMDQIAASIVLIFVVRAGLELLSDGMRVLLDVSLDQETLSQVRNIVNAEHAVSDITSLIGRNAGRYRFIQITVTLRVTGLRKAHEIVSRIETKIQKEIPRVQRVVIHYEPVVKSIKRGAVPLNEDKKTIPGHLGDAPLFGFITLDGEKGTAEMENAEPNPHLKDKSGKGLATAEWLIEKNIDLLYLPETVSGKGPVYALSDAGVRLIKIKCTSIAELMEKLPRLNHT